MTYFNYLSENRNIVLPWPMPRVYTHTPREGGGEKGGKRRDRYANIRLYAQRQTHRAFKWGVTDHS